MEETAERRPLRLRLFRVFFFCLVGLTLHGVVLIGAMISGHPFVPSQIYVNGHDMIARSIAIPGGCLVFVLCCGKFAKDFQARDVSAKTILLSGFGVLVLPFIFAIVVRATVLTAYPLWFAALLGKETQLEFAVADTEGSSSRCPYRVDLAGMPMMTGTLCGVPDEFRRTLHRGTWVVLTGRGTDYGLFAAGIDIVR